MRGVSAARGAFFAVLAVGPAVLADWPSYQGGPERNGCIDGIEGPAVPSVLWTAPGKRHFLAAPACSGGALYLSALGAFNSPELVRIALEDGAAERISWTRRAPALVLPSACAPVVRDGVVIAGEGMHQDVAGAVTAFSAADGLPLWRLEIAGELRHVEGAPALASDGRIYFGCGSGGLVAADGTRVRIGGRVVSPAEAERVARGIWRDLLAAYEKEKLEDPDFAVPPDDGALLERTRATVETAWTAGEGRWHIDAPILAVEGPSGAAERLVAGSAFLDDEKEGLRALLCLDAATGGELWSVPLEHNPWGAPSLAAVPSGGRARRLVLATASSVRYDPSRLDGARGEVLAVDLETGERVWRREVGGGILGSVAVGAAGTRGVVTATDGVVRALDTASGDLLWESRGKAPFLAGPALAGGHAYAVDLDGEVRAMSLASGDLLWRLDLASHPGAGFPGRAFAPPVCAGGRVYAVTHNVEGPRAGSPAVIVAIGEAREDGAAAGGLRVDPARRRVEIEVEIAPRKLPHLDKIYPIEVVATTSQGKKAHETVLVAAVAPSAVHRALESLGLRPGKPAVGEAARPEGPEVHLFFEYPGRMGLVKRVDLARSIVDRRTGLPLGRGGAGPWRIRWIFTGSSLIEPEAAGAAPAYAADASGTLVTVFPVTSETVLQSNLDLEAESLLDLEVAPILPPPGTRGKLVLALPGEADRGQEEGE